MVLSLIGSLVDRDCHLSKSLAASPSCHRGERCFENRFGHDGPVIARPSLGAPTTGDLFAGITVALVLLPQSLAYAEIAGVPPAIGLAAAALPPLVAAFFASSPFLQTGPVALTSLLTFGALETMAATGSTEYVALAALLALIVGVVRVALGLVRGGIVAYVMTDSTVLGFTSAAAILIIGSQVPTMFGTTRGDRGVLEAAAETIVDSSVWSSTSVVLALITIVVVIASPRIHPLFPGVLIVVVGGVAWSRFIDYGGQTIGELPGGFVSLSLDLPWDSAGSLILPGIIIALVGYAEPASIARTFAAEEKVPWNSTKELVSQGVANLASGLAGGFPVGGSFSRSALNHLAGARSVWAGGLTGLIILILQPASPLLEPLPRSVLGAIVFASVFKLVKIRRMIDLISDDLLHSVVAWGTFAATLAVAPRVERGVLFGIGLSMCAFTFRHIRNEGIRSPVEIGKHAVAHLQAENVPQPEAAGVGLDNL